GASGSAYGRSRYASVEIVAFRQGVRDAVVAGNEFGQEFMQTIGEDLVHVGVGDHAHQIVDDVVAACRSAIHGAQAFKVLLNIARTMDQRARHFRTQNQEVGDVMGLVAVVIDVPIGAVG